MHKATRVLYFGVILLALLVVTTGANATVKKKKPIATGKDFYCVFPKATWGNQSVGILINSPTKQKITVTTPTRQKGILTLKRAQTTTYYGGQFRVQSEPEIVKVHEATRIQSPDPISIHGQFGINGISGTYTALPVSAWGTEYYVVDCPEGTNTGYWYYPTIYSVPMVSIIAMRNGTVVQVNPTATTAKGHDPGVTYNVSMNEGDVYNITTQGDPKANPHVENACEADLTGTHLMSNFPIGVIVAQTHNTWPCGDNECGDYCVEFIPPVCNWDSEYVISPSVPRLASYAGEGVRIVFGYDGTDFTVEDGGGARTIGTFAAGQFFDYPQPLSEAIVVRGSKPFLPVEILKKPANCFTGTSGGENWTLGMVTLSGVNQWGDYTPFSTAIGSQSVANIFFRFNQRHLIKLNGKPLIEQFPIVKQLAAGFAYVPIPISAGSYNELVGDSGATAGGSIFGFGSLRAGPNDGSNDKHTQDPEVIKSFAHPIGVNALPACDPDVTPPHVNIVYQCGHWAIDAYDDEQSPLPPATGLYDIWLSMFAPPDTSFNVQFNPIPAFQYGTTTTTFGIDIINLAQPAQAALHLRDGAGNEYDTVLIYTPQRIDAVPESLAVGAVRVNDSVTGTITLINQSEKPALFTSVRLRYGKVHHWEIIPPSPTPPFTIQPHDSVVFTFKYTSPNKGYEWDDDTLFVTTCKEFPIALLSGFPKQPLINTTCYDFGNAVIDTAGAPADQVFTYSGMWAASIGSDTLHISEVRLVDTVDHLGDPNFAGFPQTDYEFVAPKVVDARHPWPLPTPTDTLSWWKVTPGDTAYVSVLCHPHHSGPRNAWVYFENDAKHQQLDTGCLTVIGLAPGLIAQGIDYGTHLYATTMDSFFVVKNTGQTDISLRQLIVQKDVSDTDAFAFRVYFDSLRSENVYYDTATTADNKLYGNATDSFRIPYRFIARKLGDNEMHITIGNTSTIWPEVKLVGKVIEPKIWAAGSCNTNDSVFVGGMLQQTAVVGNSGTDSLLIEAATIGGPDGASWTIQGIAIGATPVTVPFKLGPKDSAVLSLQFKPTTHIGPYIGQVQFTGVDQLNRHKSDSASSFYNWGVFPYDTTVGICNAAFANGIAVGSTYLEEYVTQQKTGRVWIYNTGMGPIDVTNITDVNSPDVTNSFIQYFPAQTPPFTIAPKDSVAIDITFSPQGYQGQATTTGRRNYDATLEIENSTGTTIQSRITGRGYMVDMHAFIDKRYQVAPGRTVDVDVVCDQWVDTLGLTDVRGIIYEMIHYRRTIVMNDTNWCNSGANLAGTLFQGALEAGNPAENYNMDSLHNFGQQGYYELNFRSSPQNVGRLGVMFRQRFLGLVGLDTSVLDFMMRGFQQATTGQMMNWIIFNSTSGLITVDSVCGIDIKKVHYGGSLALRQNSPNPVATVTNIEFEQPGEGHVFLAVYNSVGDCVARLVNQTLTKGTFQVAFDAKSIPSGLYTYRLETASGAVQKQIIIFHLTPPHLVWCSRAPRGPRVVLRRCRRSLPSVAGIVRKDNVPHICSTQR
jgi:hypothetical protein